MHPVQTHGHEGSWLLDTAAACPADKAVQAGYRAPEAAVVHPAQTHSHVGSWLLALLLALLFGLGLGRSLSSRGLAKRCRPATERQRLRRCILRRRTVT